MQHAAMELAKAGQEGRRRGRKQLSLTPPRTFPPPLSRPCPGGSVPPAPPFLVQEEPQLQQEYEMDEWLVNFARAFSDITGIDPIA